MKIGMLSDAHGNFDGFLKALYVLKRSNVDEIYFLGDAVGYVNTLNVLTYLNDNTNLITSILGNHDAMLLRESSIDKEKDKIYQLNELKMNLPVNILKHLKSLPSMIRKSVECGQMAMMHGSPDDLTNGYIYPDSSLENYKNIEDDFIFMANTHRPFIREFSDKVFVNIGSCGLPRDNGSLGGVCVFDTSKGIPIIYRYEMKNINSQLIESNNLHDDVVNVLLRTSSDCYGEKLNY